MFSKKAPFCFLCLITILTITILTNCGTKNTNEQGNGTLELQAAASTEIIKASPDAEFNFSNEDVVKFIIDFNAGGGKTIEEIADAAINESLNRNSSWSKEGVANKLVKIVRDEELKIQNAEDLIEELEFKANPGEYITGGGLKNVGNTCFMNATLQACIHKEILDPSIPISKNIQTRYNVNVAEIEKLKKSYSIIYKNLKNKKPINIKELSSIRDSLIPLKGFRRRSQEDAAELLGFLLDIMGTDNTTIENKTTITCKFCKKSGTDPSIDKIPNLDLNMEENKTESMDFLIKKYFAETEISGWKCPHCNTARDATKKMSIENSPEILIIIPKRFTFDNIAFYKKKNNLPIEKVEEISINANNKNVKYKIKSVIRHDGDLDYGHYYSYIKDDDTDNWKEYNDSSVSKLGSTKELENGYIFIYEKTN